MDTYNTIIELSKILPACKKNKDNIFIKELISKIYDREVRDEKISRIAEIEAILAQLSFKLN